MEKHVALVNVRNIESGGAQYVHKKTEEQQQGWQGERERERDTDGHADRQTW